MTPERAASIRDMREVDGDTARMVAGACYDAWGNSVSEWSADMRTNQLVGHDLIKAASLVLGEYFD